MFDQAEILEQCKDVSASELFQVFSEHSIWAQTDKRGRIIAVNDKFCEISGYSRKELIGNTHSIVNSGIHTAEFWQDMWSSITKGKTWTGEICNRSKTGSLYWVESTIAPLLDAKGITYGYFAARTDVTEQKLSSVFVDTEREALGLIAKGLGLTQACQAIVEGLSNLDPHMAISVLSRNPDNELEHIASKDLSLNYIRAIDGTAIGPMVGSCGAAIHSSTPVIVEDISTHPNWQDYKVLAADEGLKACWSFPILGADGNAVGAIAGYPNQRRAPTDHEHHLLELAATTLSIAFKAERDRRELVDAKIKAEVTAEARTLFISNMNHELRTPLNHILGFADLLLTDPAFAEKTEYIELIRSAGLELLGKVEKAIEVSERHEVVEKEPFNVSDFLDNTVKSLVEELNEADLRDIRISCCTPAPIVMFSKGNLSRALRYVIENAIKYTESDVGRIDIEVETNKDDGIVIISIKDNGPGLDQHFINIATAALEVGDPSYSRKYGGMGLGLAAASTLLQQSMGSITLDNLPKGGAEVKFMLPLRD